MDSTKSVLQPIQHLRGLAAMAVVWHHAREQWLGSSIVLPGAHGDLGVDLFFVISGLIMVVSTDGRDLTPTRFLGRRLVRVVPLYWLATLSMVVLWLAMPSLFRSLVVTPEALAASLLFIPHFSVAFPDRIWPVLVPGWSLNYEMFFYAIFALTLTAPVRARVPGLCLLTGLLILLGATFEFESAMARTYTSPMLAQFCAGALVGWIWCRGKGRSTSAPVSWLLMIGALGFLTVVPDAGVWWRSAAATGVVCASLCCARHWPRSRMLHALGDASYSIYLSHLFVLGAWRAVWSLLAPGHLGVPQALALSVCALALCAGAGWACYRWVEAPMTRFLQRFL